MLHSLTRKLCPFLTLAVATIGCGKKISESQSNAGRLTEHQQIPSAFILHLDGGQTSARNYSLIADAQFKIPDRLIVRKGNPSGRSVEIAHEIDEDDNTDYMFKCIYIPSANSNEMKLSKCVDYDDNDFGDVSNNTFTLYKSDLIQIRFAGASAPNLVVEAIYSMNWIYPKN